MQMPETHIIKMAQPVLLGINHFTAFWGIPARKLEIPVIDKLSIVDWVSVLLSVERTGRTTALNETSLVAALYRGFLQAYSAKRGWKVQDSSSLVATRIANDSCSVALVVGEIYCDWYHCRLASPYLDFLAMASYTASKAYYEGKSQLIQFGQTNRRLSRTRWPVGKRL
jgi:hypothetical protein